MKVKFENVPNMKLAGFKTRASFDNASKVLPEFWKNCFSANLEKLYSNGYKAKDAFEEFLIKSKVGSFGCPVSVNENEFDYLKSKDAPKQPILFSITAFCKSVIWLLEITD